MAVTTSREDAGVTVELRSAAAAEALLLDVVHRHADELLRVAEAHSLCADDAHDAYQRGLEHFLRNGRRLRRETAERWLFTVIKHEAQAVRRARSALVASEDFDFERLEARSDASPEDRALAADAVARSAEALRALKPQEVRALWLRAGGTLPSSFSGYFEPGVMRVFACCPVSRLRLLPGFWSRTRLAATRETGQQRQSACSEAPFSTQAFRRSAGVFSDVVGAADLRSRHDLRPIADARVPAPWRAVL